MNRRRPLHWATLIGLTVAVSGLLLGCREQADPNAPPPLQPLRDVCAECGMAIVEVRFSAGYLDSESGTPVLFDDIGDMVLYLRKHGSDPVAFVHDRETKEWLRADAAWYVHGEGIGGQHWDIAAFADEEAAGERAQSTAVLTWSQVTALPLDRTPLSQP